MGRLGKVVGENRLLVSSPDRQLDRQEEAFLTSVVLGWRYSEAYQSAYGKKMKKNVAQNMAWKLMQRPAVIRELALRRKALTDDTAATREEKRNILAQIARDPELPAAARVSAVVVDNRMTGDDEPKKALGGSGSFSFTIDPIGNGTRGQKVTVNVTEPPKPPLSLVDGEVEVLPPLLPP